MNLPQQLSSIYASLNLTFDIITNPTHTHTHSMADLNSGDNPIYQSKQYSEGRPNYPRELFHFILSNTPSHELAWDAACPEALQKKVGSESTYDLVTTAQAMHWFHLPTFYQQVKWLLKKPNGVIAAWCYTTPEVNPTVDSLFQRFYTIDAGPYWKSGPSLVSPCETVEQGYKTIDFPFEPVEGHEHTGPFRFNIEKVMDLEGYFTYLRSWSAYEIDKQKGVELLTGSVMEEFTRAWSEDGKIQKTVIFPIYLRMGKVGLPS
ncbi:hypothetical protein SASPL_129135 [Salvia splendens]|uniref:Methyltransferase type 11 domain-containing protein n=1 Tax=Salvia splendens TaxID=180675 RepID=A0A8X8XGL3_SALSN|nr:hypothetical protein SASPL_129135 [Salvia splendens]